MIGEVLVSGRDFYGNKFIYPKNLIYVKTISDVGLFKVVMGTENSKEFSVLHVCNTVSGCEKYIRNLRKGGVL